MISPLPASPPPPAPLVLKKLWKNPAKETTQKPPRTRIVAEFAENKVQLNVSHCAEKQLNRPPSLDSHTRFKNKYPCTRSAWGFPKYPPPISMLTATYWHTP